MPPVLEGLVEDTALSNDAEQANRTGVATFVACRPLHGSDLARPFEPNNAPGQIQSSPLPAGSKFDLTWAESANVVRSKRRP